MIAYGSEGEEYTQSAEVLWKIKKSPVPLSVTRARRLIQDLITLLLVSKKRKNLQLNNRAKDNTTEFRLTDR